MKLKTKDMTSIAIGVAVLIAGGYLIYAISQMMPLPGFKYMMMAPYMSMVMYVLQERIKSDYAFVFIGLIFAAVMTIINVFMGLAILSTTILSHLSALVVRDRKQKNQVRAVLFSGFTGLTSLLISKYMIGGVFVHIRLSWSFAVGMICSILGIFGILMGKKIMKHIRALSS